jgi:hypothetical protein
MGSEVRRPPRLKGLRRGAPLPWASLCVSALLLAAIGFEAGDRAPDPDVSKHSAEINRLARTMIPFAVGDWMGRTIPMPEAAIKLLRPSALEARAYESVSTGETANLLFVHCSDARDLLGHYPPVCYQARGLTLTSSSSRDWKLDGTLVTGTRYRFLQDSPVARSEVVVDNFMVLPDGRYGRDMGSVDEVAKDRRLRRLGVAEVQVVTDGAMSETRRDEVFRTLVGPMVPLLRCTGAGTERK